MVIVTRSEQERVRRMEIWRSFSRFWVYPLFGAVICAISGLFTLKVEVSGKEGKIPLSCSELFLAIFSSILSTSCFYCAQRRIKKAEQNVNKIILLHFSPS